MRTPMTKVLLLAAVLLSAPWSYAGLETLTNVVDLGDGNADVVKMYQTYFKKGPRCDFRRARGQQRILLTGFGLYGTNSNISGAIIKTAMAQRNLPRRIERNKDWSQASSTLAAGRVTNSAGVDFQQREIVIDGKSYSLCLLVLNVVWDFSAAVVVTEMQAFQPHHVVLFGQTSSSKMTIEGGASNKNDMSFGYSRQGGPLERNTPIQPQLFSGLPSTISLSINQRLIAEAIASEASTLGISVSTPASARPSNDYICNHLAYAAESAARGKTLPFAGGQLTLNPSIGGATDVGFIHVPAAAANRGSAAGWMRLLVDLIAAY